MKKYIDHAKKQPEHIRTRIALVASVVVTCIIIAIWVLTLTFKYRTPEQLQEQAPSPFQLLVNKKNSQ